MVADVVAAFAPAARTFVYGDTIRNFFQYCGQGRGGLSISKTLRNSRAVAPLTFPIGTANNVSISRTAFVASPTPSPRGGVYLPQGTLRHRPEAVDAGKARRSRREPAFSARWKVSDLRAGRLGPVGGLNPIEEKEHDF